MKITKLYLLILTFIISTNSFAQYDSHYVERKTVQISGETISIQKLLRKNGKVKLKYFASKYYDGTSVFQRYSNWAKGRNIITLVSRGLMTDCDVNRGFPVGLCIDNGLVVNEQLYDNMDGLVLVYATGGAVATNLKNRDLSINFPDSTRKVYDIKENAYHRAEFIKWAKENECSIFQSFLLAYKNEIKIDKNTSSPVVAARRFLAVCKRDNIIFHYILNFPSATTLYNSSIKAFNYLKEYEDVDEVVFLVYLDAGCHNLYKVFDKNGIELKDTDFTGYVPFSDGTVSDLLVYYYE